MDRGVACGSALFGPSLCGRSTVSPRSKEMRILSVLTHVDALFVYTVRAIPGREDMGAVSNESFER
jgi:hypothetical protein